MSTRSPPTRCGGQHGADVAIGTEAVDDAGDLALAGRGGGGPRDVLFGVHRFDGLLASLGITRSVLTDRLNHLVAEGVLERRRYQTRPDRFEYHATAEARELWPVLGHLMLWGERHYAEPEGPPRVIEHVGCGGAPDEH
jgi:DNA-binding HxlR family transcriptional regulator